MPEKKKKTSSSTTKKKSMNEFMKAKEKARKEDADEFEYTNKEGEKKIYKKFVTSTGMITYKCDT